jgi:hypothetical protein
MNAKNQRMLMCAVAALPALLSPTLAMGASTNPTVTVVNTTANPVPVSGSITVGNAVVPVEVSNANPIPVTASSPPPTALSNLVVQSGGAVTGGPTGEMHYTVEDATFRLTGFAASLWAVINPNNPGAACLLSVTIRDTADRTVSILFNMSVVGGQHSDSPFVPLPNIAVPVGYQVRVSYLDLGTEKCGFAGNLFGLAGG